MKKDKLKLLSKSGSRIIAARYTGEEEPQLAELTLVQEGQAIDPDAELIEFSHDGSDDETMCDVTTLQEGRKGPARISNRQYRNNYDAIFGKPTKQVLN